MKYYNLIFAVFHLWRLAITTLDKQSCFFIIIFAVFLRTMIPIWYFHPVNYFIMEKNTLEIETLSCLTSKIWGFEFEFRPSKVNSGQNYFCCSKAHIIISYSIFDFNVFRVSPLTSKSHLGLKKVIPFESPYMNSYLTSMDTISLSCTIFELFDSKIFGIEFYLWRLNVVCGRKKLYYSKAHIWHHLSISYRFRYIRLQSV